MNRGPKKKSVEQRIVWQWIVRHPIRGYVTTRGYFMNAERVRATLKEEYFVIRKIESTWISISENELRMYEML